MDEKKSQEEKTDRIWPVLEVAARGLLHSKGCSAEQADVILVDMRPRCAGIALLSKTKHLLSNSIGENRRRQEYVLALASNGESQWLTAKLKLSRFVRSSSWL